MANTGRGVVKSPNDKRLKANRPPSAASLKPKTRHQKLLDGDITVEDLTDEELQKGRCADKNGRFSGPVPGTMPTKMMQSVQVEFRRRVQTKLNGMADAATDALLEITQNRLAAAPARVQAALALLDRTVGKVEDKVINEVILRNFEDLEGIVVDVDIDAPDELAKRRSKKAS